MTHKRGDVCCTECRPHYPLPCKCGGLIHATKGCVIEITCDKCSDPTFDDEPKAAGLWKEGEK